MKKVLMTLFVLFAVVTAYAQEMYVGVESVYGEILMQRELLSLSVLISDMS